MPKIIQLDSGKEYVLEEGRIAIGRNSDNDIVIDDRTVSGQHAHITVRPSDYIDGVMDYVISDNNSTNGTLINGRPLKKSHLLKHHDFIQLGQHRLQFIDEQISGHESTRILLRES